ncbi:MAG: RluA family pseudouridine synthase [Actinomycetota bacterium]
MNEIAFVVGADESGKRLDVVVTARTGLSRTSASALSVTVNGEPAAKSLHVEEGMRVVVALPVQAMPPDAEHIDVPIAFEDDHLIVVNKPAGLVVHPAPGHEGGTLVNALLARASQPAGGESFRPGIVHRLDAGTSGLLVVAKTEETFELLTRMLAARTIRRIYIALVEGAPESETATIEAPIGRSPRHRKKMGVVAGGKDAVTHYAVKESFRDATLLEVTLETGRTHQIRVHLAEIGHPVLGDVVYGKSRSLARRFELSRMFLHAAQLSFAHPVSGEAMAFEAPLPEDLHRALELARTISPGKELRPPRR